LKLYYSPGACSLSPHIVAREAGIPLELVKVDIRGQPHRTETGQDFREISPNGYVPALELDDGPVLTEGTAIVQYLAELAPEARLVPSHGSPERWRLLEWLSFIGTELHKTFSPWLFHPETGELAQDAARHRIGLRLAHLDRHLTGRQFLVGDSFTVADAYAFTILSWARPTRIDLTPCPNVLAYLARIGDRPRVREALAAEGLLAQAA
jgi:glutathione S-transferase